MLKEYLDLVAGGLSMMRCSQRWAFTCADEESGSRCGVVSNTSAADGISEIHITIADKSTDVIADHCDNSPYLFVLFAGGENRMYRYYILVGTQVMNSTQICNCYYMSMCS